MKNLFFFSLLLMLLFSCKDRDEQDTNVLPEATQTGANTGGALVNGEIWVAQDEYPDLNPGGNNTMYSSVNNKYVLKITLRQYNNNSSHISFYLSDSIDINIQQYTLDWNDEIRAIYIKEPTNSFDTNGSDVGGNLTITKFDKVNKIVSGTFSFKAKNLDGEVVTITDGRFDKQFL